MPAKSLIPFALTALRLVILPFLIIEFFRQNQLFSILLFIFAVATDFLDGFFARKLKTSSEMGGYADFLADFFFIVAMFTVFIIKEIYPFWILFLVIFVFAQFLLANLYLKKISYDPIGKHYGSFLFIIIGLTLVLSNVLFFDIITLSIVIVTVTSLLSRLANFYLKNVKK